MSGPPYELQSLPAIINFSGGRSSAFQLTSQMADLLVPVR